MNEVKKKKRSRTEDALLYPKISKREKERECDPMTKGKERARISLHPCIAIRKCVLISESRWTDRQTKYT